MDYGIKIEYRFGEYLVYYNGELLYKGEVLDDGIKVLEDRENNVD